MAKIREASTRELDMMVQYRAIKAQHQDAILLFRFGDFYEMFEQDAEVAARELHLILTSRPQGRGRGRVPMCGIPHHRLDSYVARLVGKGYRVAICEQLEEAKQAKGLLQRGVIRVVTPGTHFEFGEGEGFLVALLPSDGKIGVALLQLSTGEFLATEADTSELPAMFAKFRPREVLLPDSREVALDGLRPQGFITKRPREAFLSDRALSALEAHFHLEALQDLGFPEGNLGLLAAGALLQYAKETQRGFLPHISPPKPYRGSDYVFLDPHTQRNLELTESLLEGKAEGSLFSTLDSTLTGMGRRRLKQWLLHPLLSVEEIRQRQDSVEELVKRHAMRAEARELCSKVLDLERLTSRVTSEIARPRDLVSLKVSLSPLPKLRKLLAQAKAPLLRQLQEALDPLEDVRHEVERVLLDEPRGLVKEGGIIRDGVDPDLDELRKIQQSGHRWLSELEARERERTGIQSLKVGFNKVFGYYIEVTRPNLKHVPEDYTRRQTLVNGERFVTEELRRFEEKALSASERSRLLEYELFRRLREWTASKADRLRRTADALGRLDALCSLAEVAARKGWVRPQVEEGYKISIKEGRHPVVEAQGGFVPNDLSLDEEHHLLIITGPNASGKSTFVRQAALLVLLAQVGSFVPAEAARIGLVDRIFTRIGAADFLAKGLSTFMMEMMETANILKNATRRSLVILDEVGRGTGTSDGMCIAQAVVEHLAHVGAKTLFTTHYHELACLAEKIPGITNARLEVREEQGDVTFLYKVIPGIAQKSYGIHVAKLAGLPDLVLERAQELLKEREGREATSTHPPLQGGGLERGYTRLSRVEERLLQLDPLRTTPFDALLLLAELKGLIQGDQGSDENPGFAA